MKEFRLFLRYLHKSNKLVISSVLCIVLFCVNEIAHAAVEAPVAVDLLAASDSGVSDDDNLTNVTLPTIEITAATEGATINIFRDSILLGQADLISGVIYQYTFAVGQLAAGNNHITSRSFEGEEESPDSPSLDIVLDVSGPRISLHGPAAPVNLRTDALQAITVTFNESIDYSQGGGGSFTNGDLMLTGPSGGFAVTNISFLGGNQYQVEFSPQINAGVYTINVGPEITDRAGNPMDQDADGQLGEAGEDNHSFTFEAVDVDTVFSGDTYISASNSTHAGEDIYIHGATVVIDGAHVFNSLRVANGGVINHTAGIGGFDLTITGDLLVDTGGKILMDGKGYGQDSGPGAGGHSGSYYRGSGGGHGGAGGNSNTYAGGGAYCSVTAPSCLGSGGGDGHSTGAGGSGGGNIRLTVAGLLTLDGDITANGGPGTGSSFGGGGSGGSIYITAGTLSGVGRIEADGGDTGPSAGGGGGGRIAVYTDENSFTGSMTAFGGVGGSGNGGAGTIYTKLPSQAYGMLLVDNGGNAGASTPLIEPAYSFDSIDIKNGGNLEVSTGTVLSVNANTLMLHESGQLTVYGRIKPVSQDSFTQITVTSGATLVQGSGSTLASDSIDVSGGTWRLDDFDALDIQQVELTTGTFLLNRAATFPAMHIASDAVLSHTAGATGFDLTITGDLQVDTGGKILMDGKGHGQESGPGAGSHIGRSWHTGSGGGHGGAGGSNNDLAGGSAYCSTIAPVGLGSGGGDGYSTGAGGSGGGSIRLTVAGLLTLDGDITANGSPGTGSSFGGGGSGGSIYITAGTLSGEGRIEADGGDTGFSAGGGGGGRIAVYTNVNDFTGPMTAFGGVGGYASGGDGVIQIIPHESPIQFNIQETGHTEAACDKQIREFQAFAGQQIQLKQISMSQPGLMFDLAGPNGWRGFTGLDIESDVLTIPESGRYLLTARDTDQTTSRAFSYHLVLVGSDFIPPNFTGVRFEDADGSGDVSSGDQYLFTFNESMFVASLSDNTNDANTNMSPEGASYGDTNLISWNNESTEVAITITAGFSVLGNEIVEPSDQITDASGNLISDTIALHLQDDVPPTITQVAGNVASPVPATNDYRVIVQFSSRMETAAEPTVTITAATGPTPNVLTGGVWSTRVFQNDTYTTPAIVLTEGLEETYAVNVSGAQDPFGNVMTAGDSLYTFILQAPPLTITNYPIAPAITNLTSVNFVLEGGREADTSVWLGGSEIVAQGSGDWIAELVLDQGLNSLVLFAKDANGIPSKSVTVNIFVDSIPPVVNSYTPAHGSNINTVPPVFNVGIVENGSGLNLSTSTLEVRKDGVLLTGSWVANQNVLTFTPDIQFLEGNYQATIQLVDNAGLSSGISSPNFTIDQTPPAAPTVEPLPTSTSINQQQLTGTKEAYAAVLVNGQQRVGHTAETTWAYMAPLSQGLNDFSIKARDRASNTSLETTASITFDDSAPGSVVITVNGIGDGTQAVIDWSDYDEVANGNDIQHYRVYIHGSYFTHTSEATPRETLPQGTKSYTAQGLNRGQTYYFAVVATDTFDNANLNVTPESVATTDDTAPEDVTNLHVDSFSNQLVVKWTASANSNDLAGYKVYFNNDATGVEVPAGTTSYTVNTLIAATAYPVRVTAYDNNSNESDGVTIEAVTLLPNPSGVTAEPFSSRVAISWLQAEPQQYVKQYAVYASTAYFDDVTSMTPNLLVSNANTSTELAGLTNGTTYYIAVTTINQSDGETKTVSTVSETPQEDQVGPVISPVTYDSAPLADGSTVTQSGIIGAGVSDPSGVSRVLFDVDGTQLGMDANGDNGYTANWNIVDFSDGLRVLTITAYDTLENSSSVSLNLTVELAAPAAPVITTPSDGAITNLDSITVSGTAEQQTEAFIYVDTIQVAGPLTVNSLGQFSALVNLIPGSQTITAKAENRGGLGSESSPITVELDDSVPDAPKGLTAQSAANGQITLTWMPSSDARVVEYKVYRSTTTFTDTTQAALANLSSLTASRFDDLLTVDGIYYYRVVGVNDVGTESLPSNEVTGVADNEAPHATEISYTPAGNYDVATGRMAPGRVDVVVTVSEPLLVTPFLSITPDGGVPISLSLSKSDDTTYAGWFDITDATKTGTAYAVFSARDAVGNRGNLVDVGASILIDTDGPAITHLIIAPAAPIKNDQVNPVDVSVDFVMDDALPNGQVPQLQYRLSGAARQDTDITGLVQVTEQSWRASFQLPADAGLNEVENLQFLFSAVDDLGNVSTAINAVNSFQVYQGELPPLETPANLIGTALPGGVIHLEWREVVGAAEYQIYRQAPDEGSLTEYIRVTEIQFDDTLGQDGEYIYTVASVRKENGQDAPSGQSNQVTVTADATLPDAPQNFALQLVGAGIQATWDAPATVTPDLSYNIYRAAGTSIASLDGLTPIKTDIVPNINGVIGFIDNSPSENEPAYVATTVDAAGNESLPSNSDYLNVDLYPVATLSVVQQDSAPPVISWTHTGTNINGYNLYLGASQETQLNSALLTELNYSDSAYTSDARIYTVTAIDVNSAESVGRTVILPQLSAQLSAQSSIKRGIMNRIEFVVSNNGADTVDNIRLRVEIGGHVHLSQTFSLAASETSTLPMVVGGFTDLTNPSSMVTTIEIRPNTGELVDIVRTQSVDINDDALLLTVDTQELVRDTQGQVRFTMTNTSEVEIELLTALNATLPSPEIRALVYDEDGNVLSTQPFSQPLNNVVTTSGKTVARIAAGASFTSDWFGVPIPESAPDNVTIELQIDKLHYHLTQADAVEIEGMTSSQTAALSETPYYATVDSVAPQNSFGDEPIVITGSAIDRSTTNPLASVPLHVVVVVNGFERSVELLTDADGNFTYTFNPLEGESGLFEVSAIYPNQLARPAQGQFTISRVTLSPTLLNLKLPKNVEQQFDVVEATASEGTTATNLRLELNPADQPSGLAPQGITLDLSAPFDLQSQQTAQLPFSIAGDNSADASGTLYLRLLSDESGTDPLGMVQIDYRLQEAHPYLSFSPNYIETGVAHDGSVQETITLQNTGLVVMSGVNVELLETSGGQLPNWISLLSPSAQGDITVGEKREIQIAANPSDAVAEANYPFILRVSSSNNTTVDINVYVVVTQSGIGSMLFKAADIYTATLDENGTPIPGLAGARIRYQHEIDLSNEGELYTDELGEAFFQNLPAGRYRFRASASKHEDLLGRFTIKPGVPAVENIFLDYNLISVEWSVREITIEDKYEIVLEATFETDVPAPVIVFEPTSTTLPDMPVGEVFHGELRLTNHGLVRADDLTFSFPTSDAYFKYEFQQGLPNSLEAKESLVIPYRVTALASLTPDGSGSGGGCAAYGASARANYNYECANGTEAGGSSSTHWSTTTSTSDCGGPGSSWSGGSSGSAGGGYGGAGGYTPINTKSCPKQCPIGGSNSCVPCQAGGGG